MSVPYWPPALRQQPQRGSFTGGPQDNRVKFDPEYGPPIVRRAMTAETEVYQAVFSQMSGARRAVFKAFYTDDLAGGIKAFVWRDPVLDDVALWRIIGSGSVAYQFTPRGADLHDLSLQMMRLPGSPWFAPYVRPLSSRPPSVVADWTAGVYGIGGDKVAAGALLAISGTFDVWSVSTGDVETFAAAQVIAAGGIPATAPGGVKRRVYFAA